MLSPTPPMPPTSARATIGSSWIRPARTSERWPRGPTRAGASRPETIERAGALPGRHPRPSRGARWRRAGRSSTRPARSRGRENETTSQAAAPAAERRRSRRRRPGPRRPTISRFLLTRPDRDRHRRLLHRALRAERDAHDGMRHRTLRSRRDAERPSRALKRPSCPGCGEPWLRPTQLPGRFRCVYCLQPLRARLRSARTAASTRRSCG